MRRILVCLTLLIALPAMAGDSLRGEVLWFASYGDESRDCTQCHGRDLTRPGEHIKTGKVIDPISPSVNPKRFTDRKKIEKWFKRNCKWVMGRECTASEKEDLLAYLRLQ